MANERRNEGTNEGTKLPSLPLALAPLRRLQNVPPAAPPPCGPRPQLQPVFDGGVGGGGGGKRVAFQNSFRVRQRLESSVAAVIAWENKHERSLSLYFNVRH